VFSFQVITSLARAFSGLLCNNNCKYAAPGGTPDRPCYFITRHASVTERQAAFSILQRRCLFKNGEKEKNTAGLPTAIKMLTNAGKVFHFIINKLLRVCVDDVNLEADTYHKENHVNSININKKGWSRN
jgi:hypothetical protein